jgi:D-arabinose 1-dehydrogenase-like Zn-dependent alcohol dehydrogenase
MLKFSAENNIFPIVEEFSFEDFPKAFAHLEHSKPKFRAVVNV